MRHTASRWPLDSWLTWPPLCACRRCSSSRAWPARRAVGWLEGAAACGALRRLPSHPAPALCPCLALFSWLERRAAALLSPPHPPAAARRFDAVGGVSAEANNEAVAALAGIEPADLLMAEWCAAAERLSLPIAYLCQLRAHLGQLQHSAPIITAPHLNAVSGGPQVCTPGCCLTARACRVPALAPAGATARTGPATTWP